LTMRRTKRKRKAAIVRQHMLATTAPTTVLSVPDFYSPLPRWRRHDLVDRAARASGSLIHPPTIRINKCCWTSCMLATQILVAQVCVESARISNETGEFWLVAMLQLAYLMQLYWLIWWFEIDEEPVIKNLEFGIQD
jgi:hypothetical protein